MTGYLRHLVQRTLGSTTAVRPMPSSFFAPWEGLAPIELRSPLTVGVDESVVAPDQGQSAKPSDVHSTMSRREEVRSRSDDQGPSRQEPRRAPENPYRSDPSERPHDDHRAHEARETPSLESSAPIVLDAASDGDDLRPASLLQPSQEIPEHDPTTASVTGRGVQDPRPRPTQEPRRRKKESGPAQSVRETESIRDQGEPLERVAAEGHRARAIQVRTTIGVEQHFEEAARSRPTSARGAEEGGSPPDPAPSVRGARVRRIVGQAEPTPPASSLPRRRGMRHDDSAALAQVLLMPRLPAFSAIHQTRQSATIEPEEKTVHVTIGRVEIRAVPAPPPQRRAAPTRPTLSLSEYLDRRSGGHR